MQDNDNDVVGHIPDPDIFSLLTFGTVLMGLAPLWEWLQITDIMSYD